MEKEKSKMIGGYIMAGIGFLMLLANAVAYIFSLNFKNSAFTVMGLVFVTIGMQIAKKYKTRP